MLGGVCPSRKNLGRRHLRRGGRQNAEDHSRIATELGRCPIRNQSLVNIALRGRNGRGRTPPVSFRPDSRESLCRVAEARVYESSGRNSWWVVGQCLAVDFNILVASPAADNSTCCPSV